MLSDRGDDPRPLREGQSKPPGPPTPLAALDGLPLSIYGDGSNVRDWLFVDDRMAEAFVRTMKRDYARVSQLPDAAAVIRQLPAWFEHYNTVHPHRARIRPVA